MLTLDLTRISADGARLKQTVAADDPAWRGDENTVTEPVEVEIEASDVGGGILVLGRIRTTLSLACRRCLEQIEGPVEHTFEVFFQAEDETAEDDDEAFTFDPRMSTLDVTPAVRDQMLLRVPPYPVCREACRGLCAQCGVNLNDRTCDCVPERSPGPWDALKDLKFT